ncbi:MAG: hypothetical protein B1H05_02425 [Candidatus Cloacimonas sp. 4484_140]|nr:MAG: hypothetical protein B1H05_02425 [Candidatus Cloacimonas sp. 4484_140]
MDHSMTSKSKETMAEDVKIACENCTYWHNHHCENFSSKWMGMVTSPHKNCGQFKAKKLKKKKEDNKKKSNSPNE